jgi:hypothetical protein
MTEISPFDFMNAVSFDKKDLIRDNENPELAEKQYSGYMVNRGFSNFEDTILHANEMNMRHGLFNDAQFRYYLGSLRKRKRFSKWTKADKSADLDAIQHVYQCNRTVAKLYLKALSKDDLKSIHERMVTGGPQK